MVLSIIIPTLNEAANIAASLGALQRLRAAGHEVIVADGGSVDGTPALAVPLADKIVHTPKGRARQMNAGAEIASGDVLLFLHADTRLPPNAEVLIAAGLRCSKRHWGRFDVRLSGPHRMLRRVEALMNLRSRWSGIATGDQGIFVRRAHFREVGGFPEIALMEDIALSRALKRRSRPLCLSAKVVTSSRRWEREGVLRTILLMWSLRAAYFIGWDPQRLERVYYRS